MVGKETGRSHQPKGRGSMFQGICAERKPWARWSSSQCGTDTEPLDLLRLLSVARNGLTRVHKEKKIKGELLIQLDSWSTSVTKNLFLSLASEPHFLTAPLSRSALWSTSPGSSTHPLPAPCLCLHSSLEPVSQVALARPPAALHGAWVGEAGQLPNLLCYLTTKIYLISPSLGGWNVCLGR